VDKGVTDFVDAPLIGTHDFLDDALSGSDSGDDQLAAGRRANDLALLRANLAGQTAHGNCAAALSSGNEKVSNSVGFSPFVNTATQKKTRPSKVDTNGQQAEPNTSSIDEGGILADKFGEAIIAQEVSQRKREASPQPDPGLQQEHPPSSQSPENSQAKASQREPLNAVEVHSPPVAAAASTAVTTKFESPQKLSLIDMMAESVQHFEAKQEPSDNREVARLGQRRGAPDHHNKSHEVPEVAGLDISFDPNEDARQVASGMAASLLTQHTAANAHDKQRKNFLSKVDTIDDALKKVRKEDDDSNSGLAFMARKPQPARGENFGDNGVHAHGTDAVLSNLRKAYHPVASSSQHVETRPAKAPEETAEEIETVEGIEISMEENWNAVEARTKQMASDALANRGSVATKTEDPSLLPISYKEIQDWLRTIRVDPEMLKPFYEDLDDDQVKMVGCGCLSSNRRRRKGDIPYLHRTYNQEKDLVLFLTKCDFDFNISNHFRMLRTVYTKLTRNKSCPSIGAHWEVIGFQGGDPRTDINRSGGVLNILHLYFFLTHNFDILKACWLLSQDHEQHFPMACISINITQTVLEAFLAGSLSNVCNKGGDNLFETLCKIHNAALFYFYSQWRHQKRTIVDTDRTKKEIKAMLTKKPAALLDELNRGVEDDRKRQDPNKLEFTSLDFGTAGGSDSKQAGPRSAPPKQSAVPVRLRNYSTAE
jgi:hypothetical protein